MRQGALPGYLEQLNDEQREAVLYEGASLLILAGAGSGKTRVITTKIAYLIGQLGYEPESILAVTFTNKAAGEMKERVSAMAEGGSRVMIRTFHSFGAWLCRRHAKLLGFNPHFTIYDDDDSLSLLHTLESGKKRRDLAPYARSISRAKDYALGPDDSLESLSRDPDLPRLYRAYEQRLRDMGNADFGDLILQPVRLLQEHPEVKERLQRRFRVILVDEYQDSNVAQYHLLRELAGPDTRLCVVGDDDQSIYRFRGAEVQNIISFPELFPDTHIIRLEQNYRSTARILRAASELVANNKGRLGKTLRPVHGEGVKIRSAYLEDQSAEALFCAQLLESEGNLKNTAILYRTNAQSAAFETIFLRRGIPYKIVGALRFYEREEIKDALALLSLLQNPKDEIAFRRIVNKPSRGIGAVSASKLCAIALESCSGDFVAACSAGAGVLSGKAAKGAADFFALCQELERLLETVDLTKLLEEGLRISGLLDYHKKQDEIAMGQKSENLQQLLAAAGEYPSGAEGLNSFLEDLELDRSRLAGKDPADEEGVTLITMHNTKGLEFDRVIISGLEEGLFPGRGAEDEDELEEERRIFYVSITRARYELYLTSCRRRMIWGRTETRSPSRFLRELPEREIEDLYGGSSRRRSVSASPSTSLDYQGFPPGTRVYHDDYGEGMVASGSLESGELVIQVLFETGQKAQFLPRYSGLERIGDEL